MDTLSNRVVAGDQLSGIDLIDTREQLRAASTSEDKFAVADQWLAANFDQAFAPPHPLVDAATTLQEDPTRQLSDLTETFGGSQKHLISQFKKFIGITPKQYQRVLRFNSIFAQMQSDQFLSWSDIAYQCGYADQSHFIREFKAFSGFIPEAFLQEGFNDEEPNFFPLDRDEK
ncbi:MAG: helix-turn-helix domain-containing protein [Woeseiaceae bacterium]